MYYHLLPCLKSSNTTNFTIVRIDGNALVILGNATNDGATIAIAFALMSFGQEAVHVRLQHTVFILQHIGQHLMMESAGIDGCLDARLLPKYAY